MSEKLLLDYFCLLKIYSTSRSAFTRTERALVLITIISKNPRNIFKEYLIEDNMIPLIASILTFQIGGYYGGSIGNLLLYWEQAGFFSYILPFLLIFAVVFGILTKMKLFGDQNKGLNAVIAITVGLLSLQFNFVTIFFSEIFPRLGIGLSVILALFILVGLFLPSQSESVSNFLLLAVGVIVFLVVIMKTFGYLGYGFGISFFIWDNLPLIILVILVIVAVGAVIGAKPPKKGWVSPPPHWQNP